MNGIRLLLFFVISAQVLVAFAQVEIGTERDYGWSVNKDDGALEYIVQIDPDKKRRMELRSVQYPDGQESASNMPRELIGRASRVVVRFGTAVLPREPSLQELERTPRLFESPNVGAAAMLGPGSLRDLEPSAPVRDIQGQGSAPVFPSIPNSLSGSQIESGSFADQAAQTANTLRNNLNESLSSAMPDPGLLAQNLPSQLGGSSFLNETRGDGSNSKFNNTANPASSPSNPATNPQTNTPTKPLDYPPTSSGNSPFASGNQPAANNTNNRTPGFNSGLGTINNTPPLYPADRNLPSLNNQTSLPQQRTPSPGFGTSTTGNSTNDWNNQTNPTASSYPPSMSQPNDRFNYGTQQSQGGYPNTTLVATNPPPYVPPPTSSNQNGSQFNSAGLTRSQVEAAMEVRNKLDKNKDGNLTPDEYAQASMDGILLALFVLSLLANLYLGHLIRKLLIRYRSVLTNVRSQAAYT